MPNEELHFFLIPLMAQGHMIPMIDLARMLAKRGVAITITDDTVNANRFKSVITREIKSKLQIKMVELSLLLTEVGLPERCENFDLLPSADVGMRLFSAAKMLQEPVEKVMGRLKRAPSCIISDLLFPWTMNVAHKFNISRLVFHGPGCFYLLCLHYLQLSGIMDEIFSDSEPFVVPGLPDRVEFTKAEASGMTLPNMDDFHNKVKEAEEDAYGVVVNSFQELELEYFKEYVKAKDKNVWLWALLHCTTKTTWIKQREVTELPLMRIID